MKTKRFVLLTTTALFGAASALSVAKAWSDARELNAMASESAGKLPSLASTTPSPAPCYGADVGDKVCREDWQGIGADGGHLILDQNKLRELPRGAQAWFCELAKEDERTQKLVKNASGGTSEKGKFEQVKCSNEIRELVQLKQVTAGKPDVEWEYKPLAAIKSKFPCGLWNRYVPKTPSTPCPPPPPKG